VDEMQKTDAAIHRKPGAREDPEAVEYKVGITEIK
jgi:hypothetical protein